MDDPKSDHTSMDNPKSDHTSMGDPKLVAATDKSDFAISEFVSKTKRRLSADVIKSSSKKLVRSDISLRSRNIKRLLEAPPKREKSTTRKSLVHTPSPKKPKRDEFPIDLSENEDTKKLEDVNEKKDTSLTDDFVLVIEPEDDARSPSQTEADSPLKLRSHSESLDMQKVTSESNLTMAADVEPNAVFDDAEPETIEKSPQIAENADAENSLKIGEVYSLSNIDRKVVWPPKSHANELEKPDKQEYVQTNINSSENDTNLQKDTSFDKDPKPLDLHVDKSGDLHTVKPLVIEPLPHVPKLGEPSRTNMKQIIVSPTTSSTPAIMKAISSAQVPLTTKKSFVKPAMGSLPKLDHETLVEQALIRLPKQVFTKPHAPPVATISSTDNMHVKEPQYQTPTTARRFSLPCRTDDVIVSEDAPQISWVLNGKVCLTPPMGHKRAHQWTTKKTKVLGTLRTLLTHCAKNTSSLYNCHKCHMTLGSESDWLKHTNSCDVTEETNDVIRNEDAEQTAIYTCSRCKREFTEHSDWLRHRQLCDVTVTEGGTDTSLIYYCNRCPASFVRHKDWVTHRKSHTVITANWSCDRCLRKFTSRRDLRDHRSTCTIQPSANKYRFQCKICAKSFPYPSALKVHSETHVLKHKCPICDIPFTRFYEMTKHVRADHPEVETHSCEHCGKVFDRLTMLYRHKADGLCPVLNSRPIKPANTVLALP